MWNWKREIAGQEVSERAEEMSAASWIHVSKGKVASDEVVKCKGNGSHRAFLCYMRVSGYHESRIRNHWRIFSMVVT